MSKIYTSADQLIGHTPLLELTHIEKEADLKATVPLRLVFGQVDHYAQCVTALG